MKKLTKKCKDVKVEITFAESKEYDTVKETFIEGLNEDAKIEKTAKKMPKLQKKQISGKKGESKKRGDVIEKKQIPKLH